MGKCPGCEEWGTLEETSFTKPVNAVLRSGSSTAITSHLARSRPQRLSAILTKELTPRLMTGLSEFDRVLGGGIVPGALILIGGDPGVGKSTLLTQVAGRIANQYGTVLYVSGEESAYQIKIRAERLGSTSGQILVQNETDVTSIAMAIRDERPQTVVVDSIQTMFHPEIDSFPGSVAQVRASTATLTQVAKSENVPVFLVGHVTKEGSIAGPKVLEHMVDTVLTFEGDRHHAYRILRGTKNRFGSTDEIGLFQMFEEGLVEVTNPSESLLSERTHNSSGSSIVPMMEGSRPLLVEIQALVAPSFLSNPRRVVNGVEANRVNLILAVLEKRFGMMFGNKDVFLNVAGGVRVDEPASDLSIAIATASSHQDVQIDSQTVIAGEVGLGGEVRAVSHIERRLAEASRLGFTRAIVPSRNKSSLRSLPSGIVVLGVETVGEAIGKALVSQ